MANLRQIPAAPLLLCLCLSLSCASAADADDWTFTERVSRSYDLTLNLRFDEALTLLDNPTTAQEHYVINLAHALELVLTEDGEKYEAYHDAYSQLLEKRTKSALAEDLFLQAELRLQWAFVFLKFGHEFDAAWNLRQAFLNISDCQKKYPDFIPARKTAAVLDVLIGSVPEKYDWVLSLMGMKGSLTRGIDALNTLRTTDNTMQREAALLYAVIQGFIMQDAAEALTETLAILQTQHASRLAHLLGGALAIKAAQSEKAMDFLDTFNPRDSAYLHFVSYLKGEVYLHEGAYQQALDEYRWFANNYRGQHYLKDAWYKMGLCAYLEGKENDARVYFSRARSVGREDTEADKHASRALADSRMPHRGLLRARYFTDGGYYEKAGRELSLIRPGTLTSKRDQGEYHYRHARLAHKTGKLSEARRYYDETIRVCGNEPWYFAPNACLQMGYISLDAGDTALAKDYFIKARKYPRHEYKNSIDSKAKSALATLGK
ncbi:MAG TPA: hypothetical protein VKZ86_10835 [Cyclobacteriaceae bacterium]|nr:hypothetical protein [Cyclobacteriaceae bacterium]